ncbi:hypothetical protein [Pediococcus parvulus]|uniref:hypothetical protein n=1 Tax=Pediococcus parvulus TaxID=54062 RepID=UPI00070AAABA|nr:hypothetical protein [Pediococcus parvulus]MCT3027337.1 hypothetical protein [Pediococcus parvulus]GEL89313.1 hypothetical protein PPA04_05440 [Pediococcus parvulus]GHC07412.1 hypothetical protein GCM10008912_08710 [Pediococcus parvulus]
MLQVDEKQTMKNAKTILKQYPHYERMASRKFDDEITKDAVKHVQAVEESLEQLDKLEKFILENRYINCYRFTDVAKHVGMGTSRFSDYQQRALLEFAEAYTLDNLISLAGA